MHEEHASTSEAVRILVVASNLEEEEEDSPQLEEDQLELKSSISSSEDTQIDQP